MPLNINTTGTGYQNLLSSLQTIRNQLNNNYKPFLKHMDEDQLRTLVQNDELLRELVLLYKDVHRIRGRIDR